MIAQDIINDAEAKASEYTEMVANPAAIVAGILANRIVKLNEHIEYLERRLHASTK